MIQPKQIGKRSLTNWRVQKKRQVKMGKECEPVRGTHFLKSPDTETSQDVEIMRASEGYSLSGEPRHKEKSGHETNAS